MPLDTQSNQSRHLELNDLANRLSEAAGELDRTAAWPEKQLQWCGENEVYRWFIPEEFGGFNWDNRSITEGYLTLAASCLTTTFVLTQWNAACKRLIDSDNHQLKSQLLPEMANGNLFATVGISHLTTSRQHVAPVLRAERTEHGFVLNGLSPWVTGAPKADVLVVGATQADGTQILAAIPRERDGVDAAPGSSLVALNGSCTDKVQFHNVKVKSEEVVAGPRTEVLKQREGTGAGGLQTSTLAIGLAMAAGKFLSDQCEKRSDLQPVADKIKNDISKLREELLRLAAGESGIPLSELREQANSLALRSTQAALQAAKGAGFLASHPTGRWAREAMFFLVWSCPQAVANANLCEFAQLSS